MSKKIRALISKVGLDGHDRGAKTIARAFRDAGIEVVYGGLRQSPSQIVNIARDEDVDVVGVSILSGAHKVLIEDICNEIKKEGLEDLLLIVGGIIPKADIPYLQENGVAMVFGPGSSTEDIIKFVFTKLEEESPK